METRGNKIILGVIVVGLFFVIAPHLTLAQGVGQGSSGITNPLGGGADQTITSVLTGIIKWMLGLVGVLALIAIIIGGGRMIIDFGNEDQVRKAKVTITWAVIGLLVVILSYAIINIVSTQILGASGGSSSSSGSTP